MTNNHPEVENIIMPVAGVGNWGSGSYSTAAIHFASLRESLKEEFDMPVLPPTIPTGLGFFETMKNTYQHFEEDVEKAADVYPNARILFVAHSLGGLLCRELIGREQTSNSRYIGAITLGSPHRGMPQNFPLFSRKIAEINSFADNVTTLWPRLKKGPSLALVSTSHDIVVPPKSALPPLSRANRYFLSDSAELPPELEGVTLVNSQRIDHLGLVFHRQAIELVSSLASELIEKRNSSAPRRNLANRPVIRLNKTG